MAALRNNFRQTVGSQFLSSRQETTPRNADSGSGPNRCHCAMQTAEDGPTAAIAQCRQRKTGRRPGLTLVLRRKNCRRRLPTPPAMRHWSTGTPGVIADHSP
ncbi:hypothetical protein PGT21_036014 [Puccinia graminis f. sp. tritici]|uniref:Uncharacterized protein n=1 Tax=Puccinia graminis f. sp. tritici TaxID=56615 RepID=A0A5B0Q0E6_PUCGR|nr:hypothetical protein PGT21_036014 [Puccinia graminis f. sp. tritici]KAA1126259.1 hypothetical protein PGTUg99_021509 [Puccinia graminis f. sp. tritici]